MGLGKNELTISFSVKSERVPELVNAIMAPELRPSAIRAGDMAGSKTTRIGKSRWTVIRTHRGGHGVFVTFTASLSDLTPEGQITLLKAGRAVADITTKVPPSLQRV